MSTETTPEPDELIQLRTSNEQLYQQLVAAHAVPDPRIVLSVRLETFLDVVLNREQRADFDVAFESRMHELLTACQRDVAQSRLLSTGRPSSGPPGLIVPAH